MRAQYPLLIPPPPHSQALFTGQRRTLPHAISTGAHEEGTPSGGRVVSPPDGGTVAPGSTSSDASCGSDNGQSHGCSKESGPSHGCFLRHPLVATNGDPTAAFCARTCMHKWLLARMRSRTCSSRTYTTAIMDGPTVVAEPPPPQHT